MKRVLLAVALVSLTAAVAKGQDAVKTDPQHYKMEVDNDQVRILRVHYGPHEKSIMHSHPDTAVVFLTDAHFRFNMPDGKSIEDNAKAGETRWTPAGAHLPENLSDKPMDVILVEMKGHSMAKPAAKPAQ